MRRGGNTAARARQTLATLTGLAGGWGCSAAYCSSSPAAAATSTTAAAATATTAQPAAAAAALARFGLVADIQYADVDDTTSFAGVPRRYRGALTALRLAAEHWEAEASRGQLSFVMDLGDIVDQVNETRGTSRTALEAVLACFRGVEAAGVPAYHIVGNHELYNFTKEELIGLVPGIRGADGSFYHSFRPADGWRVVVLDAYDRHCITDREAPACAEACFSELEKHNPNDVRARRGTTNWSKDLQGLNARFMPFNGGVGSEQMAWLRAEMAATRARGERVVVFSHVPLLPGAAAPTTLLWNYEEVLEVLRGGNCAAVFAGHDHRGGYKVDERGGGGGGGGGGGVGVHHVTIPSPLSTSEEKPEAHAVVELHAGHIEVLGRGIVPSRRLELPELLGRPSAAKL